MEKIIMKIVHKDKVRTAGDRERDDIRLKQLEVNVMKARLDLQDLELQYTEFRDKLEVTKIMESDAYSQYQFAPFFLAQSWAVIPPAPSANGDIWNDKDAKNLETLYTTVSNTPIPVPLPEIAYKPSV